MFLNIVFNLPTNPTIGHHTTDVSGLCELSKLQSLLIHLRHVHVELTTALFETAGLKYVEFIPLARRSAIACCLACSSACRLCSCCWASKARWSMTCLRDSSVRFMV
ncbi:hypothetical protein ACHAW6_013838 [Cyclotella cf. meneghiniana]